MHGGCAHMAGTRGCSPSQRAGCRHRPLTPVPLAGLRVQTVQQVVSGWLLPPSHICQLAPAAAALECFFRRVMDHDLYSDGDDMVCHITSVPVRTGQAQQADTQRAGACEQRTVRP